MPICRMVTDANGVTHLLNRDNRPVLLCHLYGSKRLLPFTLGPPPHALLHARSVDIVPGQPYREGNGSSLTPQPPPLALTPVTCKPFLKDLELSCASFSRGAKSAWGPASARECQAIANTINCSIQPPDEPATSCRGRAAGVQ